MTFKNKYTGDYIDLPLYKNHTHNPRVFYGDCEYGLHKNIVQAIDKGILVPNGGTKTVDNFRLSDNWYYVR